MGLAGGKIKGNFRKNGLLALTERIEIIKLTKQVIQWMRKI